MRLRILTTVAVFAFLMGPGALATRGQQPRPSPAQEGFVPVDQLPAAEELPASRLVIAAYSVAWVVVFGYLWTIGNRLGRVEHEIAEARKRVDAGSRR